MKLDPAIHCDDGSILEEINASDSGVYFIFRIPNVVRGIHGKSGSKSKVDELIIVGVPWYKAVDFASKYGIKLVVDGVF